MNSKAENAVLDFLTKDENLPFVLDILRRGKRVRRRLICEFWLELQQHLCERAPNVPPSPINSLRSSLELVDKLMDKGEAGLYYWESSAEHAKQCLSYVVWQEQDGDSLSLCYGLSWEARLDRDSGLRRLPAVKTLKKRLKSEGFTGSDWCLGYKVVSDYETVEDFLLAVKEDREPILRKIEDFFLPLVQETATLFSEANQAVLAADRR